MGRLNTSERARLISALVEGNSLRSISRMYGMALNTVLQCLPQDRDRVCVAFSKKFENPTHAVALRNGSGIVRPRLEHGGAGLAARSDSENCSGV